MKMIYLHGFNSTKDSETAKKLLKHFPELITISYNYIDPDVAEKEIDELVKKHTRDDLMMIGSSLGGFWALYFAQKYLSRAVVFNPSIYPSQTLKKYIGKVKNYSTGEEKVLTEFHVDAYKHYEKPIKIGVPRTLVLGVNDEVLDYRIASKLMSGIANIIHVDEKHRLSNVDNFAEIIKTASNNFPEYTDGE